MNDRDETVTELEEMHEQIKDLVQNARRLLRHADHLTRRRAESGWVAQIQMALDHDHEWLGRASVTMQETIEEMRSRREGSE